MVCRKCITQGSIVGGVTIAVALLVYLYVYYVLAEQVTLKHSADLTAAEQQEFQTIQAASDQRIASADPKADYLRRKNAFDAKYGTHGGGRAPPPTPP